MGKMMESFSPSSDGYQFMWIILAIGMVGLGFSLERFLYIVIKSGKGRGQFLADFGKLISAKQYDQALSVANSARYPIAKIMAAIVGAKDGGRDAMQSASDAEGLLGSNLDSLKVSYSRKRLHHRRLSRKTPHLNVYLLDQEHNGQDA